MSYLELKSFQFVFLYQLHHSIRAKEQMAWTYHTFSHAYCLTACKEVQAVRHGTRFDICYGKDIQAQIVPVGTLVDLLWMMYLILLKLSAFFLPTRFRPGGCCARQVKRIDAKNGFGGNIYIGNRTYLIIL